MCVEDKEVEGGRLVLRCAAVVASACQEEDDDDEPFEAIARLKVKPEEGRTLYFTRHGESEYNLQERIGGDPGLTRRGERYAKALGQYVNAMGLSDLHIWTSTLRRTHETAAHILAPRSQTHLLDEIKSGCLDGYTYKEIEAQFPEEWEARERDKLRYRYPKGESYMDCCRRILPVLVELEHCHHNVLVVAHQAILRCVFGYLLRRPIETVPFIKIPQHAIMQVTLENGDNVVDFIRMPVEHIEQGITVASQDQPKINSKEKGGKQQPQLPMVVGSPAKMP